LYGGALADAGLNSCLGTPKIPYGFFEGIFLRTSKTLNKKLTKK